MTDKAYDAAWDEYQRAIDAAWEAYKAAELAARVKRNAATGEDPCPDCCCVHDGPCEPVERELPDPEDEDPTPSWRNTL